MTDISKENNENQPIVQEEEIANDNLLGRVVSSEEESYQLYNDYAMRIGFSVRKGKVRFETGTRVIKQREYFCSKEGYALDENPSNDKRLKKLETRTGCKARIRFTVKDGLWMVTSFNPEHNHELASEEERHLLRSQRGKPAQWNGNDTETVFHNCMMRFAYNLILKSQGSASTREICQKILCEGNKEVEKEIARLKFGANANVDEEEHNGGDIEVDCTVDEVPLLNHLNVRPEGVSNARFKGHFEKRQREKTKQTDHSKKSKQSMTQASPKNPLHPSPDPSSFHKILPTPMIFPIYAHHPNPIIYPICMQSSNAVPSSMYMPSPFPSQNSISTWRWGQFSNPMLSPIPSQDDIPLHDGDRHQQHRS